MQLSDLFAPTLVGQRDVLGLETGADGQLRQWTFGELDQRARHTAAALVARGVAEGDRLCVYLANDIEFIDLFLACTRLGVILVPINVLYREREVAHIVSDADPVAVVTTIDQFGTFPPGTACWDARSLEPEGSTLPEPMPLPLDGDTPAALVYTSGTTGRSKGAVLTHNNFMANAVNLVTCWRITAADRYLAVLPLFHVHGLGNGLVSWLASGCRMRLVERFDLARADGWFRDFRPTLFFGVPTVYVRLLELAADDARDAGASMRLFVCGSAPLPAHVLDAFAARFGHTILERYGMSETLMNTGNPYGGERRAGSVGFPFPGVSLRIVDEQGRTASRGTVGEVWVRGPNVCAGYWRQPEATSTAFAEGWFHTGDLGAVSDDGYLTLHGRRSDLIISGGFNIYPREIEELLLEQPGVREAAVVGVPDSRRGELPVAYLVGDGIDRDALQHTLEQHLASFKVPRALVMVDHLPRTALGKVQKHLLPPWSPA